MNYSFKQQNGLNQSMPDQNNFATMNKLTMNPFLNSDSNFNNSNSNHLNFNYNNNSYQQPRSQRISLYNFDSMPNKSSQIFVSRKGSFGSRNDFDKRHDRDYFENGKPAKNYGSKSPANFLNDSKRFSQKVGESYNQEFHMSESDSDERSLLLSDLEYDKNTERQSQIFHHAPATIFNDNESVCTSLKNRSQRVSKCFTNKENNYDNHQFQIYDTGMKYFDKPVDYDYETFSKMHRKCLKRSTIDMGSSTNRFAMRYTSPFQQPNCPRFNTLNTGYIGAPQSLNNHLKMPYRSNKGEYSSSSSDDSLDATHGSSFTRDQFLINCHNPKVTKSRSLYYDSGIGADANNIASNSFYSKDRKVNNIKYGEVENGSSSFFNEKTYENFLRSTPKNLKQATAINSKKINYKTMNPAMMRKFFDQNSEFQIGKKFDDLFIQPSQNVEKKSFSQAEMKDHNLAKTNDIHKSSKSGFGSMMAIPIIQSDDLTKENSVINENKTRNFSNNTADFTPHLIKNRSNSVKETNRSITPTNSTRFNYIAVGSMSTLTSSMNHGTHRKLINSPKHHERTSSSAISQLGDSVSNPTQAVDSSKFTSSTLCDMNTSGCRTPKTEMSSRNINIIKNMNFNRKARTDMSPMNTDQKKIENKSNNDEKRLVAINDYLSLYAKNISLVKGEKYTLISQENEQWYFIRDQFGHTGYAPANHLEILNDYDNLQANTDNKQAFIEKEWFHDNLNRSQAYSLLVSSQNENGTYLVRNNSSDKGKFTLCVFKNGKVYNYKINAEDDKLFLSQKHKFNNLIELIDFYKKNSAGLISNLKFPFGKKADKNSFLTSNGMYKKFTIERKEIEFFEKIGSGQFGIVLKAEYKKKKMVAVKKMKPGSKEDELNFKREAEFMMRLQNLQETPQRNLVQFVGISKDFDESVLIVTEYLKYGSLYSHLMKHKERIIKSKGRVLRLLNICIDVCDGMSYLESNGIIHRDLATRNCLVGDGEIIKVADYGLARFTESSYIAHPQSQFPVKWSAPEVIKHRSYSNKSDVWSFSCLMYEVFTLGKMPYGGSTINSIAAKQIISGIVPEKPFYCPTSLYENVLKRAWNKDAKERPTFKELTKLLEGFIN